MSVCMDWIWARSSVFHLIILLLGWKGGVVRQRTEVLFGSLACPGVFDRPFQVGDP
ncbi:hypothetical protein BJY04DRAFT_184504 [Aspergillus karnatakaensis]|uniref:uncharacterized protein n=1 Tax=Aspergillus karnatakaensis TaxID=1810916 RepID=UPI003CCE1F97